MSSKIQKDILFQSGMYMEGSFIINAYQITLDMQVLSESMHEQFVAVERVNYFINHVLENSIFVNSSETNIVEQYTKCGLKVCTLPDEPYDQVITIMMFLKLNAITEGRLSVNTIGMSSKFSEGIRIFHEEGDPLGPFEQSSWWNENNLLINNHKEKRARGKVVKLFPAPMSEWADIGLTWKEKSNNDTKHGVKIHLLSDLEK